MSTQTNTVLKKETITSTQHKMIQNRTLMVISARTEKSSRVMINSLKVSQAEGSFLKIGKKTNDKLLP